MSTRPGVVVVGSGQAGFETCADLRSHGYDGAVTLIGDEPGLPYQRPPLSKAHLHGGERHDLNLRPATFFAHKGIEVINDRVTAIDRGAQCVELASGQRLAYDQLVLATGSANRRLNVPGSDLPGVGYLRTHAEADVVRTMIDNSQALVVVGAGFIGLEVAAAAQAHGVEVTVVEAESRLMGRAVSERLADWMHELHRRNGTRFELEARVETVLDSNGKAAGVRTHDGREIRGDAVVIGVGVVPNTELAARAGLEVANGIVVDQWLRTRDPHIHAIGDCAASPGPTGLQRLESVQNAVDQARCVAGQLTGKELPYRAIPWFWTDQFGARVQMAGVLTNPCSTYLRGDREVGRFSIFCVDGDDQVVAVESVNRPRDHLAARRLLAMPPDRRPAVEELIDERNDLKSLLGGYRQRLAPTPT